MLDGVTAALEEEFKQGGGIIDLDKVFFPATPPPVLSATDEEFSKTNNDAEHPYVREARLILSPYARPNGWYVRLANRSLAQALLVRDRRDVPLRIASKHVKTKAYVHSGGNPPFPGSYPNISDATIRVENCPDGLIKVNFLNFFTRFDLSMEHESVVPWSGETPDGKVASSRTYLVQFADASWARAALRELQGAAMSGQAVRLVQFPRQIIS